VADLSVALMGLLFAINSAKLARDPCYIHVGEDPGIPSPTCRVDFAAANNVFDSVKRIPDPAGNFADGGHTGLKIVQG
jgi:hypothetical protein